MEFESDENPSVVPQRAPSVPQRTTARTPRTPDSFSSDTAELEAEDGEAPGFTFPISRTASASPYTQSVAERFQSTATRQRIEECYDLLKESAFFDGKQLEGEGIAKEVARYIRGGSGWTFLHQAAFWDHDEAVKWLLKHGADRSIRGRFDGKAPYDVALANGRPKANTRVLELLEVSRAPQGGASRR
jgi:hypothetical protein